MQDAGIAPETVALIITEMRRSFPGEKIYLQPLESQHNAERAAKIREAAKQLPTGVVCERFGVSRQLVHYHIKKGKTTAK